MSALTAESIIYERAGVSAVGVLVDLDTFTTLSAMAAAAESPRPTDDIALAVRRYARAIDRANAGGLDYAEKVSRTRAVGALRRQLFDLAGVTA